MNYNHRAFPRLLLSQIDWQEFRVQSAATSTPSTSDKKSGRVNNLQLLDSLPRLQIDCGHTKGRGNCIPAPEFWSIIWEHCVELLSRWLLCPGWVVLVWLVCSSPCRMNLLERNVFIHSPLVTMTKRIFITTRLFLFPF